MSWGYHNATSQVIWTVEYMGLTLIRGFFKKADVQVNMDDDDLTKWSVDATVYTDSLDSADADRDHHLRGPDYFEVEKYPTITFKSTRVERDGDAYRVYGPLTMHGITKEVVLNAKFKGEATDARGNHLRGISAETTLKRGDFGISAGTSVGPDVHVSLEAELLRH
jgi:polyisoprenoid-binding protein YceI